MNDVIIGKGDFGNTAACMQIPGINISENEVSYWVSEDLHIDVDELIIPLPEIRIMKSTDIGINIKTIIDIYNDKHEDGECSRVLRRFLLLMVLRTMSDTETIKYVKRIMISSYNNGKRDLKKAFRALMDE